MKKSFQEHEIIEAAQKVSPKGLAWDFIGSWIPRLLLLFSYEEIKMMYHKLEELTGFISESIEQKSGSGPEEKSGTLPSPEFEKSGTIEITPILISFP